MGRFNMASVRELTHYCGGECNGREQISGSAKCARKTGYVEGRTPTQASAKKSGGNPNLQS
jgi:hypothetical protein